MTLHRTIRSLARLCAVAALCVAASAPACAAKLVLGAKNFTEQYVLAELTAQYLRARGDVEVRSGLGSTLVRSALENGQFDLMWDYTGTAALVYNKINDKLSPDEMYRRVKALDVPRGRLARRVAAQRHLCDRPAQPARAGHRHPDRLAARRTPEDRSGREALRVRDGRRIRESPRRAEAAARRLRHAVQPCAAQADGPAVYTALHNNQLKIGLVYTTDGRVKGFGIVPLEDDKHFFPPYNATPVVQGHARSQSETCDAAQRAVGRARQRRDAGDGQEVDLDGKSPRDVADAFLRTHKLP